MAAADTARLIASLELQDRNFTSGTNKVLGSLDRLDARVQKSSSVFKTALGTGLGFLGARAVSAAASALPKIIGAASDLAETQSKVSVVFGQSAKEILDFGKNSATALGQSEAAALAAAATYGNLFVSMGLVPDKAADMSKSLVTLATDLASFNNISTDEALEKLRAGLTGESEPLKTLGININEAIIKQKAFDLGLVKTTKGTLPAAIKAQAAYALIFEQSATAQGDFERTSSGLANQQRILRAQIADTAATVGTGLLPGITKVVTKLNELVQKNQPAIAEFARALPGAFDSLLAIVGQIPFEQIGTSLQIAGTGAHAILNAFLAMPPWIQTAIITGWGLNKLTGGALGGIVGELGKGLIKGVLGMNAGIVNITAATVGGPGFMGDVTGGGGKGMGALGLLKFVGGALLVTGAVAIATEISGINDPNHQLTGGGRNRFGGTTFRGTNVPDEQLANLERSLANLEDRAAKGDTMAQRQLEAVRSEIARLRGEQTRATDIARFMASASKDDTASLNKIGSGLTAMQQALHADLLTAIGVLETSNDPAAIAAAVDAAVAAIRGGAGSAGTTGGVIGDLKTQLKAAEASNNPDLAAKIKAAIAQIEPFQRGRAWQQEQITEARKIVASNKTTADKTAALKTIQQDLLSHQRSMAAGIVGELLNVVAAIRGIKLPAGQTVVVNDSTGFVTGGKPIPTGGKAPTVNDQTGFVLSATVNMSTRDVNGSQTQRGRIGPTPDQVGAT